MRLDRHTRAAGHAHALDHVRIQRALRQKVRAAEFCRLLLEHLDEQPADRLALRFRIGNALQRVDEQRARIPMHQSDVEALAERLHHLLGLGGAPAIRGRRRCRSVGRRSPRGSAPPPPRNRHPPTTRISPVRIPPAPAPAQSRHRGTPPSSSRRDSPTTPCVKLRSSLRAVRRRARPPDGTARRRNAAHRRRWRRKARPRLPPPRGSPAADASPGRRGSSTPSRARPSATRRGTARNRPSPPPPPGRTRDGRTPAPRRPIRRTSAAGRMQMPSTGTPACHTQGGVRGDSGSVTDAGLPDKMMPRGRQATIRAGSVSKGQISQNTPLSRRRRAIS